MKSPIVSSILSTAAEVAVETTEYARRAQVLLSSIDDQTERLCVELVFGRRDPERRKQIAEQITSLQTERNLITADIKEKNREFFDEN